MQVFEDPNMIIVLWVSCSLLLAIVGIFLAVKGLKVAQGHVKNFLPVGRMKAGFKKSGVKKLNRSLMYISISSDNFLGANFKANIYSELQRILLDAFSNDDGAEISVYGDKTFLVFAKWNSEMAKEKIVSCSNELNKCLISHKALNVVEIRIGCYMEIGTDVPFDKAVDRAKQACILARNEKLPYAQWNVDQVKTMTKQIDMENIIEKQIESNRFFLEYQPVVDARNKKIIGAEVLARLRSENEGVLSPARFLAAVDSTGLQERFDYYIFEKNCKWIASDKKQREKYQYTINFSRSTLSDPCFVENVISIAQKYDLNLSCLAVEVLEDKDVSGAVKKQMMDNLLALKKKGMSILLDDFGSGFTTFADLQYLDISILKIDRSITQNAVTDTGFIILKNIITTAKKIGIKTLCEGVETKQQEAAALRAGCDLLQGFYYYKPMPVAALESLLEQGI